MIDASRLKTWWHSLRPLTRHWIINVLIGVAIELVLILAEAHHSKWLESTQNLALDSMMRGSAATVQEDDGKVPPLAFIDIDNRTWQDPAWGGGEPCRAPRERLLQLIDFAFKHDARQVVLDIVVEGRTDDPEDQEFAAKLSQLINGANSGGDRKLILVRTLRQPLLAADSKGKLDAVPELRNSALDPVIESSAGRIEVAAPYFKLSSDLVLRDWQLWSLACKRSASGKAMLVVVPSVQLLVAARNGQWRIAEAPWSMPPTTACEASGVGVLGASTKDLQSLKAATWYWLRKAMEHRGGEMEHKPEHEPPEEEGLFNRIVFRITDPPGMSASPGVKVHVTQVISALDVLQNQEENRDLANAIVVIGQSYPEAGDRHPTPLGDMAGSLVILNSIDSMIRHGLLHESHLLKNVLAFALILSVGYIFARWDSVSGTIIALLLVLGGLVPISYHFFKFGVWLDLALPLIGIQVHRLVKSFEERIELRRLVSTQGRNEHH